MIDWNKLREPFPPESIEWKPGAVTRDKKKGLAMAYITSRAIQDRLDAVFTPGGWKNEFRAGPEGGIICRIYFKNDDGEWVWREDGAENTDIEAVKGGLSNSMKRAGAALGIGRYLYDMPSQWVPLNDRGRFAETPRIPHQSLPSTNGSQQRQAERPSSPDVISQNELRDFYYQQGGSMEPSDFAAVLDTVRVDGEVPTSAWPAIRKAVGVET